MLLTHYKACVPFSQADRPPQIYADHQYSSTFAFLLIVNALTSVTSGPNFLACAKMLRGVVMGITIMPFEVKG